MTHLSASDDSVSPAPRDLTYLAGGLLAYADAGCPSLRIASSDGVELPATSIAGDVQCFDYAPLSDAVLVAKEVGLALLG